MARFKAGDKVKRIRSSNEGMGVGDVAVVKEIDNNDNMFLEGYKFAHDPNNFQLVVYTEKEFTSKWLKQNRWYIRTGSPEKSELIQKWLFEHGIGWAAGKDDAYVIYGTHYKMLTNTCGDRATSNIMWSVDNDHTSKIAQEITFEFETVVKSVRLPEQPKPTEQELKIQELEETIAKATEQVKKLKEMK